MPQPLPPLVTVRASALTESGLFPAVNPLDVPLWASGQNVLFKDGGPQKVPGFASVLTVTPTSVIRGADALQDEAATQHLFFGDSASLWRWNGSTLYLLASGLTAGAVDETSNALATTWSHARFGNWMISTNGVAPVQVWKTGSTAAALGGSPPTPAQIVMRRGPHILLFNNANGQSWFNWSDADNPEVWTPTATNAAGDLNIRDMNGGIIACAPLGQDIAVYGKNQMFVVSYIGAPYVFNYTPTLEGIGAVGKCAVAWSNRKNWGMSRSGFWETDGVTFSYIDPPAIRDYWKSTVDQTQLSKVVASYDAVNEQVVWYLPTAGTKENTFALTYRPANQSWSLLSYGRSAAVPQMGVYKYPVAIGTDNKVYTHNSGLDADGAAITAFVRTKPLDAGDPWRIKHAKTLFVALRRLAGTVSVRIGTQKLLTDSPSWSAYLTLDAAFSKIDKIASGAFITLEFSSNSTGADWVVSGFDLHGTFGGRSQ